MSSSTNAIPQILPNQAQQDVTINGNFAAVSPGMGYARNPDTTAGLTWGYLEATIDVSGVNTVIAAGTIALTASTTNYLYRTSAGVVTKTTSIPSGWLTAPLAAGAIALFTIVTGTDTVTSHDDHRLSTGATGPAGAPNEAWTTLTDAATVTPDCLSGTVHNFKWVIGDNRTLANPSNMVNGQVINIRIKQDGTGTRIITWGSKFKFAGGLNVLSTPINTVDLYSGIYDSSDDLIFGILALAIA